MGYKSPLEILENVSNHEASNTQGRSAKTKITVVGMRTREGKVKAVTMEKINSKTIQTLLEENIEKGSTVCTDEASHYKRIRDYKHVLVNHSVGKFVKGMARTELKAYGRC